ncbi:MAG: Maf family protein [Mobilitalea sp.]
MYQVILASNSPRRKEIMELMGIHFIAIAAEVEEKVEETIPSEMVQALAKLKADASLQCFENSLNKYEETIIIGADTLVFYKNQALGKPKDENDAQRMLEMLSNEEHEVYTGVHLILRKQQKVEEEISFAVSTKVRVNSLSLEQIRDYIATGEPMDKAGAYAIQGKFGIHIKEIEGDYYNIVGFPIARIYDELLKKGINMKSLN